MVDIVSTIDAAFLCAWATCTPPFFILLISLAFDVGGGTKRGRIIRVENEALTLKPQRSRQIYSDFISVSAGHDFIDQNCGAKQGGTFETLCVWPPGASNNNRRGTRASNELPRDPRALISAYTIAQGAALRQTPSESPALKYV